VKLGDSAPDKQLDFRILKTMGSSWVWGHKSIGSVLRVLWALRSEFGPKKPKNPVFKGGGVRKKKRKRLVLVGGRTFFVNASRGVGKGGKKEKKNQLWGVGGDP